MKRPTFDGWAGLEAGPLLCLILDRCAQKGWIAAMLVIGCQRCDGKTYGDWARLNVFGDTKWEWII
jgi:hypothetical protein